MKNKKEKTTYCGSDECTDTQLLITGGNCQDCEVYTRKQNPTTCGADKCNAREIVEKDGTCKYCELYSFPFTKSDPFSTDVS